MIKLVVPSAHSPQVNKLGHDGQLVVQLVEDDAPGLAQQHVTLDRLLRHRHRKLLRAKEPEQKAGVCLHIFCQEIYFVYYLI